MNSYKEKACCSTTLLYPVTIRGETINPLFDIPYHITVKVFGDQTVDTTQIQCQLEKYEKPLHQPIDAKALTFTPEILKSPQGNVYYVLLVKNLPCHLAEISENAYISHITIEPELWDDLRLLGRELTAEQVGIEIRPPELLCGLKKLKTY